MPCMWGATAACGQTRPFVCSVLVRLMPPCCSTDDGSFVGFCPTSSGVLRPCAPVGGGAAAAYPFNASTDPWARRSTPGLLGFPCAVHPSAASPAEGCEAGLSCYPAPQQADAIFNADIAVRPEVGGRGCAALWLCTAGGYDAYAPLL